MRNIILPVTLSLAFTLSCGDDAPPTRPEDGTVEAWDACVWDGQFDSSLCKPELGCALNGVCAPRCMTTADCPTFDGFDVECGEDEGNLVCRPLCNEARECPKTGGAELHCLDFHCFRDP